MGRMRLWNRLNAPSLETLEARLDGTQSNLVYGRCPCSWNWGIFVVPPKPFYDSMSSAMHSQLLSQMVKYDSLKLWPGQKMTKEMGNLMCDTTVRAHFYLSSLLQIKYCNLKKCVCWLVHQELQFNSLLSPKSILLCVLLSSRLFCWQTHIFVL